MLFYYWRIFFVWVSEYCDTGVALFHVSMLLMTAEHPIKSRFYGRDFVRTAWDAPLLSHTGWKPSLHCPILCAACLYKFLLCVNI